MRRLRLRPRGLLRGIYCGGLGPKRCAGPDPRSDNRSQADQDQCGVGLVLEEDLVDEPCCTQQQRYPILYVPPYVCPCPHAQPRLSLLGVVDDESRQGQTAPKAGSVSVKLLVAVGWLDRHALTPAITDRLSKR